MGQTKASKFTRWWCTPLFTWERVRCSKRRDIFISPTSS